MLSPADITGPMVVPIVPASSPRTCWAKATSGLGMRSCQAVLEHGAGAGRRLLGGLEQGDEGAVPLLASIREQLGGTEQAGDVHVVPAGV